VPDEPTEAPASVGDLVGSSEAQILQWDGQWHVGRSWPGMFPDIEQRCPCPKARCGLAAPVAEIICPEHSGDGTLRQYHHVDDCRKAKPRWRPKKK
jgi:hypothetical protein